MKTIDAGLTTSLQSATTTLSAQFKVKRKDGVIHTFTSHDITLAIDVGTRDAQDTDGVLNYIPSSAFSFSDIQGDDTLSVDGLDINGIFSAADIDEDDVKRGLYRHAQVWLFVVDWTTLGDGVIAIQKGRIGQLTLTAEGRFRAEFRGMLQAYSRRVGQLISPTCRTSLGTALCGLPLRPDILGRVQAVTVGQFYRVLQTPDPDEGGNLTITNPGFETDAPPSTDSITGWTIIAGDVGGHLIATNPHSGSQNLEVGGTVNTVIEQVRELRQSMGGDIPDAALAVEDRVRIITEVWGNDGGFNDRARLSVDALDSSDVLIENLGFSDALSGVYTLETVDATLPVNTAKLRIQLIGVKIGGGLLANFDDVTSQWNDTAFVQPEIPSTLFNDRIFVVTVAGTTELAQPTYDQDIGDPTVDGSATLVAEDAWARAIEVSAVDSVDPRKKFTVTELTPNTGGPRGGFPTDWFEGGVVVWEDGPNVGDSMDIRDYTPDDGATITQDIELAEDMPFDIATTNKARIYPACIRTFAICRDRFDRAKFFRGEDKLPGQDAILTYPDAKS